MYNKFISLTDENKDVLEAQIDKQYKKIEKNKKGFIIDKYSF